MTKLYIENQLFERIDYKETPLEKGEYENCQFKHCDFSHTDFSGIAFSECEFINCNLSLVTLHKTAFRSVLFKDSKMLGLHFDNCNPFGISFEFQNCSLNHSSFYQMNIKKTAFKDSQLLETDFTQTNLSTCLFDNCDFGGATFDNTNLEKADLRTSYNYSMNPEANKIRKAKFSYPAVLGLLHTYDIDIQTL